MRDQIDGLIKAIAAEVEFLPELAGIWDEMDDDERFAASYDWDLVVMGDLLVALERHHREGELSEEQEERYAELKADLKAAIPIIEQLDLRVPSEILK